jgi:hypothetical protein
MDNRYALKALVRAVEQQRSRAVVFNNEKLFLHRIIHGEKHTEN